MNAEHTLNSLITGNDRFVRGVNQYPNQDPEHRHAQRHEQRPHASFLCCADSRVPIELIFDQGIGDLFVNRIAGHILNDGIIASIRFSVEQLGVPLVVVLGHTQCGAVIAAIDGYQKKQPADIFGQHIRPAIQETDGDAENLVDAVVKTHVKRTVRALREHEAFSQRINQGQLEIKGAVYHLGTGVVSWLDEGHER